MDSTSQVSYTLECFTRLLRAVLITTLSCLIIVDNAPGQERPARAGVVIGIIRSHFEGKSDEDARAKEGSITGFRVEYLKDVRPWLRLTADYSMQGAHYTGVPDEYYLYLYSLGFSVLPKLTFDDIPFTPYLLMGPRADLYLFNKHSGIGIDRRGYYEFAPKPRFSRVNASVIVGGGVTWRRFKYPIGLDFRFSPLSILPAVRNIVYISEDENYAAMKVISTSVNLIVYLK